MLSESTPIVTLPTADMPKARAFYEGTLGLKPTYEDAAGVFYSCGEGQVFVYTSQFAGTNQATAVTFQVSSAAFDGEIEALRSQGLEFQTFDAPGIEWHDGVASVGASMRAVWFADPDGNIINVGAGELEPSGSDPSSLSP